MFKKKEKCELCKEKNLSDKPYIIQAMDDERVEYELKACDECGLLLSRISEKANEAMQENYNESV